MGVRELETLRKNLLEIERIKFEIDEQIFNVRQDVSTLIEARDSTLPRLRNEKKEMQSELHRIDEEIVSFDAELNNLKVEKREYEKRKNLRYVRSEIIRLEEEHEELIKKNNSLLIKKMDNVTYLTYGLLVISFTLIVILLSGYGTYTCTDGVTVIELSQVLDGVQDCPDGLDERDLGNGDGGDVKNLITGFKIIGFVCGGCLLVVFIGIFAAEGWGATIAMIFHRKNLRSEWESENSIEEYKRKHKRFDDEARQMGKIIHDKEDRIESLKSRINTLKLGLNPDSNLLEQGNMVSISKLEESVQEREKSIRQQIRKIRDDSVLISLLFTSIKHLIPNSESINPNQANINSIMDEIEEDLG